MCIRDTYRPAARVVNVCIEEPEFPGRALNVLHRSLATRGLVPILENPAWRGDSGHPQEVMRNAIIYCRDILGLVKPGDHIVGVHRIMGEAVLKVVQVPE